MRRVARRIESFSSSTAFCYGFNDRQQRIISNGCTRRSITVAALKTAQKKKPTRSWRKFLQKGKITLPKISVSHLTLPRIPQVETNTLPIVATVGNYIFRSVVLLSRKSIFARLGYARSWKFEINQRLFNGNTIFPVVADDSLLDNGLHSVPEALSDRPQVGSLPYLYLHLIYSRPPQIRSQMIPLTI